LFFAWSGEPTLAAGRDGLIVATMNVVIFLAITKEARLVPPRSVLALAE